MKHKRIDLIVTPHNFLKKSPVVTYKNGESITIYRCEECGLEGRRYGISDFLELTNWYPEGQIDYCKQQRRIIGDDTHVGKLVEIEATGVAVRNSAYDNLKPKTRHVIVEPPKGFFNGDKGVWVEGKGGTVKILFGEYRIVKKPTMVRTKKPVPTMVRTKKPKFRRTK